MKRSIFLFALLLLLPSTARAQARSFSESTEVFYSGGEKIKLECFESVTRGPSDRRPIILILYGADGSGVMYQRLARRLAFKGYAVYIPDYFARTAQITKPRDFTAAEQVDIWKNTVSDALDEVSKRPAGDSTRVAYVGFSFGASLAVLAAEDDARVRALALYSPQTAVELDGKPHSAPPALMFHSADDSTIPVDVAYKLKRTFREAGIPCFLKVYRHADHGILGQVHSVPARDAMRRTLEFLSHQLG